MFEYSYIIFVIKITLKRKESITMTQENKELNVPVDVEIVEDESLGKRDLKGFFYQFVTIVAIAMSLYHLSTAIIGTPEWQIHRTTHVVFYLTIGYILYRGSKKDSKLKFGIDILLAALSVAIYLYIMLDFERFSTRLPMVDPITTLDIILGCALILLILEMTRRTTGWALIIVALFFISQTLFAKYFPGFLKGPGIKFKTFIDYMFFTSDGIYGSSVGVSASFVYLFVLFGVFLDKTGVGTYFIELAINATRKTRGGSAKAAVLASGLFGSISGSAVANVYGTGTLTIPMMKKAGFKPVFAGAVESVASSGGAIMPPVMGSAAFLMADFIGMPYTTIIKAAIIPAILYYISVWMIVDIEAKKMGMKKITGNVDKIDYKYFLRKSYLFLPIIVLIALLLKGFTAFYAAFFAIIGTLVVGFINDKSTVSPKNIIAMLSECGKTAVTIAAPLTCAALVVACVSLTGVGLQLTSMILKGSGGQLPLAMLFTMIITIILGMGLPTAAAYQIVAIFAPSALTELGVPVLTAHLFCFYYASFSTITPPVAMAAYAGGVIAGANVNKTGFTAVRIGVAAFVIPWCFVYSDALLMNGSVPTILMAIVSALVGVYALASGVQGYFLDKKINAIFRIMILFAAVCMILPGLKSDVIGYGILIAIYLFQRFSSKNEVIGV